MSDFELKLSNGKMVNLSEIAEQGIKKEQIDKEYWNIFDKIQKYANTKITENERDNDENTLSSKELSIFFDAVENRAKRHNSKNLGRREAGGLRRDMNKELEDSDKFLKKDLKRKDVLKFINALLPENLKDLPDRTETKEIKIGVTESVEYKDNEPVKKTVVDTNSGAITEYDLVEDEDGETKEIKKNETIEKDGVKTINEFDNNGKITKKTVTKDETETEYEHNDMAGGLIVKKETKNKGKENEKVITYETQNGYEVIATEEDKSENATTKTIYITDEKPDKDGVVQIRKDSTTVIKNVEGGSQIIMTQKEGDEGYDVTTITQDGKQNTIKYDKNDQPIVKAPAVQHSNGGSRHVSSRGYVGGANASGKSSRTAMYESMGLDFSSVSKYKGKYVDFQVPVGTVKHAQKWSSGTTSVDNRTVWGSVEQASKKGNLKQKVPFDTNGYNTWKQSLLRTVEYQKPNYNSAKYKNWLKEHNFSDSPRAKKVYAEILNKNAGHEYYGMPFDEVGYQSWLANPKRKWSDTDKNRTHYYYNVQKHDEKSLKKYYYDNVQSKKASTAATSKGKIIGDVKGKGVDCWLVEYKGKYYYVDKKYKQARSPEAVKAEVTHATAGEGEKITAQCIIGVVPTGFEMGGDMELVQNDKGEFINKYGKKFEVIKDNGKIYAVMQPKEGNEKDKARYNQIKSRLIQDNKVIEGEDRLITAEKKKAKSIADNFHNWINQGYMGDKAARAILQNKISSDNVVEFLNEYERKYNLSVIDDISNQLSAMKTEQGPMYKIILDKLVTRAKREGVSQEQINTYVNKYDNARKKGVPDNVAMTNCTKGLMGLISNRHSNANMNNTDAANDLAAMFGEDIKGAKLDDLSRFGKGVDAVLGIFGCKTESEMKQKLGAAAGVATKLSKIAEEMKKLNPKSEAYKLKAKEFNGVYSKYFDVPFSTKNIAAFNETAGKIAEYQSAKKVYDGCTAAIYNLQKMNNFINATSTVEKAAQKMLTKQGKEINKENMIEALSQIKEGHARMMRVIGDGQTLEQMQSDLSNRQQAAFGTKNIGNEIATFNMNMKRSEAYAVMSVELLATVGLSYVPGLGEAAALKLANTARSLFNAGKCLRVAKFLNTTSKGIGVVSKGIKTAQTGRVINAAARTTAVGKGIAATGNVLTSALTNGAVAYTATWTVDKAGGGHIALEANDRALGMAEFAAAGTVLSRVIPTVARALGVSSEAVTQALTESGNITMGGIVAAAQGGSKDDVIESMITMAVLGRLMHGMTPKGKNNTKAEQRLDEPVSIETPKHTAETPVLDQATANNTRVAGGKLNAEKMNTARTEAAEGGDARDVIVRKETKNLPVREQSHELQHIWDDHAGVVEIGKKRVDVNTETNIQKLKDLQSEVKRWQDTSRPKSEVDAEKLLIQEKIEKRIQYLEEHPEVQNTSNESQVLNDINNGVDRTVNRVLNRDKRIPVTEEEARLIDDKIANTEDINALNNLRSQLENRAGITNDRHVSTVDKLVNKIDNKIQSIKDAENRFEAAMDEINAAIKDGRGLANSGRVLVFKNLDKMTLVQQQKVVDGLKQLTKKSPQVKKAIKRYEKTKDELIAEHNRLMQKVTPETPVTDANATRVLEIRQYLNNKRGERITGKFEPQPAQDRTPTTGNSETPVVNNSRTNAPTSKVETLPNYEAVKLELEKTPNKVNLEAVGKYAENCASEQQLEHIQQKLGELEGIQEVDSAKLNEAIGKAKTQLQTLRNNQAAARKGVRTAETPVETPKPKVETQKPVEKPKAQETSQPQPKPKTNVEKWNELAETQYKSELAKLSGQERADFVRFLNSKDKFVYKNQIIEQLGAENSIAKMSIKELKVFCNENGIEFKIQHGSGSVKYNRNYGQNSTEQYTIYFENGKPTVLRNAEGSLRRYQRYENDAWTYVSRDRFIELRESANSARDMSKTQRILSKPKKLMKSFRSDQVKETGAPKAGNKKLSDLKKDWEKWAHNYATKNGIIEDLKIIPIEGQNGEVTYLFKTSENANQWHRRITIEDGKITTDEIRVTNKEGAEEVAVYNRNGKRISTKNIYETKNMPQQNNQTQNTQQANDAADNTINASGRSNVWKYATWGTIGTAVVGAGAFGYNKFLSNDGNTETETKSKTKTDFVYNGETFAIGAIVDVPENASKTSDDNGVQIASCTIIANGKEYEVQGICDDKGKMTINSIKQKETSSSSDTKETQTSNDDETTIREITFENSNNEEETVEIGTQYETAEDGEIGSEVQDIITATDGNKYVITRKFVEDEDGTKWLEVTKIEGAI